MKASVNATSWATPPEMFHPIRRGLIIEVTLMIKPWWVGQNMSREMARGAALAEAFTCIHPCMDWLW